MHYRAKPAQAKPKRQRLVIVAVVKDVTSCANYENKDYSGSGGNDKLTSNPITAIKVSDEHVISIMEKFFEGALDYSCPSPVSYYPEPSYNPEHHHHIPIAHHPIKPV